MRPYQRGPERDLLKQKSLNKSELDLAPHIYTPPVIRQKPVMVLHRLRFEVRDRVRVRLGRRKGRGRKCDRVREKGFQVGEGFVGMDRMYS